MILLLDFDGVIHPRSSGVDELFCCRGEVWRMLAALPALEVVISSSWRDAYPVEELQEMVCHGGGEHFAHRVVGTTPCVAAPEGTAGVRELECRAWLAGNDYLGRRAWLAVDDTAGFFSPGCCNLHLVDGATGIAPADTAAIIARLRAQEVANV